MDLSKLFEVQRKLDERIVKVKGLEGQDLLDKKILALQVELGELANEWRGFKFWSEDQEPNHTGYIECDVCTDQPGKYEVIIGDELVSFPCQKCEGHEEVYVGNRLLEEYVDCLHFILSIGSKYSHNFKLNLSITSETTDITKQFNRLFLLTNKCGSYRDTRYYYELLFSEFVKLGEMLGFTWEQIEQAYYDKNKVNHERQASGY